MDDNNTRVARAIARAREGLGITQTELARRLGLSRTAIYNWERGETTPSANRLREVARALGLDLEVLVPQ